MAMMWEARCKCGWSKPLDLKRNAHYWAKKHLLKYRQGPETHAVMVQKVQEGSYGTKA